MYLCMYTHLKILYQTILSFWVLVQVYRNTHKIRTSYGCKYQECLCLLIWGHYHFLNYLFFWIIAHSVTTTVSALVGVLLCRRQYLQRKEMTSYYQKLAMRSYASRTLNFEVVIITSFIASPNHILCGSTTESTVHWNPPKKVAKIHSIDFFFELRGWECRTGGVVTKITTPKKIKMLSLYKVVL